MPVVGFTSGTALTASKISASVSYCVAAEKIWPRCEMEHAGPTLKHWSVHASVAPSHSTVAASMRATTTSAAARIAGRSASPPSAGFTITSPKRASLP